MIPLHQKVDSNEGEDEDEKAAYGHDGRASTAPPYSHSLMQKCCIAKPRYQRPDFFWVPAPVRAMGTLGHDRTGNHTYGKKEESVIDCMIIN